MEAEGSRERDHRSNADPATGSAENEETALERVVAELSAELAPVSGQRVSRETVLSDLGFDSLACADLTAAIEERFGVRLVHGDVDQTRTVADVAATVRRKMPERPRIPPGIG